MRGGKREHKSQGRVGVRKGRQREGAREREG